MLPSTEVQNFEQRMSQLKGLVAESDSNWQKRFPTERSFDIVFSEISAIGNWMQNERLVRWYELTRARKRK